MEFEPPLLDVQDILVNCRESQIDMNESDLTHPDPGRWRHIYTQMFQTLMGVSIEQAVQSVSQLGLLRVNYAEIYAEGFAQFAFTLCMQRMFCACGMKNFSVKDIIAPTPKRIGRLCSTFINMSRHCSIRSEVVDDMKKNAEQSRDEYENILKQKDYLVQALNKANESQQEREMDAQKSQEDYDEADRRLRESFSQQSALQKSVDDLNVCLAEKTTLEDNLKQTLSDIQQEVEKLSNKIVHSPERFKQDQERLMKRIQELKAELAHKEQVISQNRQLLEQTEHKRQTAEKAVKLSREVQEELNKENEFASNIQKVTESHNELCEIHSSLRAQEEDLDEKLAVRQEQRRNITWQKGASRMQLEQRLAEIKHVLMKREEEVKSLEAEAAQIKQKTLGVYEDITEREQLFEERKQAWETEYTNLLKEIDVLHMLNADCFAAFNDQKHKARKQ